MSKTIEEAFAHCLEMLEDQGVSLEDCLRRYPQYEKELVELLGFVRSINSLQNLQPRIVFLEKAGQRLVSRLPDRDCTFSPQNHHPLLGFPQLFPRKFRLARITMAVVLLFSMVIGGTVYAADAAEPGSLLYGLDRAIEQFPLSLAPDAETAATIHLDHATERLREAQGRLAHESIENFQVALDAYVDEVASLTQILESSEGQDQEALIELVNDALSINLDILNKLMAIIPEQGKEGIQRAIDASTLMLEDFPVPSEGAGPPDEIITPVELPVEPPVDLPDDPSPPVEPPVDLPDDPGPPDDLPVDLPDDPGPPDDLPVDLPDDPGPPDDLPVDLPVDPGPPDRP